MFLNPTMLAGLAGAMLPLVLHLLSRARYRNAQWGAMMFLGADDPRQSRRERLKQWTLLLLRMASVALLAAALSRPVIGAAGSVAEGPSSTVIVLDRSGSMSIAQNGPSRFESAIRAAANVVSSLDAGDEVSLITTPPSPGGIVPTTDHRQFALRLSDMTLTPNRADFATAMQDAADVLAKSHRGFKHLVVIGDRQASSWIESKEPPFADPWRKRLAGSGGPPMAFTYIPVGGHDVGNVSIESIRVVNPPVIRDVPADIEVVVHNYDTIPSAALPLTLRSGGFPGVEIHQTTVSLDARSSTTVRCSVRFSESGSLFVTARLNASGLGVDDAMDAGIEVTEPLSVLVISGDERDPSGGELRSESDFIRLALAPFNTAERLGTDMARVEVVSSDAWPELVRAKHQVVILANVPRLPERQVRQLEQFVYGGGGLIVAPGNLARIDEYNAQLWRDGSGILPAALLTPTPADGSGGTTLLGLELGHPVFDFLSGRDAPIPRVVVDRYYPTRLTSTQTIVLGQYASGQPFMIENTYGRGRVLLFTTPLDDDWSRLPRSNIYLPLLQSAVRYLAAGILPDRNVWVNQPIVAMIDDPTEVRGWMDAPGNRRLPVDLLRVGDAFEARFTNTNRVGQYGLRVETARGLRHLRFAVRAPRDESDITNLSPAEMNELQSALGFHLSDPEPSAIAATVDEARRRRELWPWLLMGVALLAMLEIGLARLWSSVATGETP